MFLSPPWQNIDPAAPAPPVPPAPSAHTSPYLNPASPKYSLPGVAIFAGLAGLALLIAVVMNRKRLRAGLPKALTWLGARLAAARAMPFPMPASAYLCGFILRSEPLPRRRPGNYTCPPPSYEASTGQPAQGDLPPGSPPPGLDSPFHLAATSADVRSQPSPPPAYPPAPPPSPDLEPPAATAASAIRLRGALSATRAPASPLPALPADVASGPAVPTLSSPALIRTSSPTHVASAPTIPIPSVHVGAPSGPLPPAYTPPLPESHRGSTSSLEVGAWNDWTAPWGLVHASSTPRASSILEARRDEA